MRPLINSFDKFRLTSYGGQHLPPSLNDLERNGERNQRSKAKEEAMPASSKAIWHRCYPLLRSEAPILDLQAVLKKKKTWRSWRI